MMTIMINGSDLSRNLVMTSVSWLTGFIFLDKNCRKLLSLFEMITGFTQFRAKAQLLLFILFQVAFYFKVEESMNCLSPSLEYLSLLALLPIKTVSLVSITLHSIKRRKRWRKKRYAKF